MKTALLKLCLFVIIFFSCFNVDSLAIASNGSTIHANNKYVISLDGEKSIVILDVTQGKVVKKQFDFAIKKIELCPSYSFISLQCVKKGVGRRLHYIYDIEQDKLYEVEFYFDINEKRWSGTGNYTFLKNENYFVLVETKKLRNYLKSSSSVPVIKIVGHPVGYIWQIQWVGKYLLYGTGVSEMECWGILDVEKRINYFISCCGMSKESGFATPCKKRFSTDASVIKLIGSLLKKNEYKKISYDFYEDISKIIKKKKP